MRTAERLEQAGLPTAQAKALTEVLEETMSAQNASVADRFVAKVDVLVELTAIKASIQEMDIRLSSEMKQIDMRLSSEMKQMDMRLNAKIDTSIANAKSELIRWVVGVGMLQMALIAGLVLKLVPQ